MRHKVKGRKLNRTKSHRQATLRALATALLKHKKIKTTVAKAKETRVFVEPMITKAKVDSVANRRLIARDIKDKEVVQELFNEIVPKIGDRPGGYTRVVKLGQRLGDAAEMAIIELVDYSEAVEKKPRKKKEKKEETPAPVEAAETKEEEVKSEDVQEAEVIEESEEKPEEPKEEASADEEQKEEVKAEEPETEEKEEEKSPEDKKEEK